MSDSYDSYSSPSDAIPTQSSDFDDFVKVPENMKVPESSSSPEVIEDPENEMITDQHDSSGGGTSDLGNLEREPDVTEPLLAQRSDTYIPSYVPAVEDIVTPPPIPTSYEGSPSRPSTKVVETPKATGYLTFLNALHPVVLYLIYWRDPKLSAVSLLLNIIVILTLYINTFLHTVTLLLLACMVVSLLYIVTKVAIDSFYNRQIVNPFNKYLEKDVSISEEQLVDMARFVSRKLNCHIKGLVQLVFFANTMKSLKTMVALFLLSYFTNCFDILTTLFLVIIDLYSIPILYSKYQAVIDRHINSIVFKITNVYSKLVEKVPFLPKLKSD